MISLEPKKELKVIMCDSGVRSSGGSRPSDKGEGGQGVWMTPEKSRWKLSSKALEALEKAVGFFSLLHVLLLAFTVLLQNKHTSLSENGEDLIRPDLE